MVKPQTSLPVPVTGAKPSEVQTEFLNLLLVRTKLPQLVATVKQASVLWMDEETAKFTRTVGSELAAAKLPIDKTAADRIAERVKGLCALERQEKDRLDALGMMEGIIHRRIDLLKQKNATEVLEVLQKRREYLATVRADQTAQIGQIEEEIKKIDKELSDLKKVSGNAETAKIQIETDESQETTTKRKPR